MTKDEGRKTNARRPPSFVFHHTQSPHVTGLTRCRTQTSLRLPFDKLRTNGSMVLAILSVFRFCALRAQQKKGHRLGKQLVNTQAMATFAWVERLKRRFGERCPP